MPQVGNDGQVVAAHAGNLHDSRDGVSEVSGGGDTSARRGVVSSVRRA
jgi:hypothetical protein